MIQVAITRSGTVNDPRLQNKREGSGGPNLGHVDEDSLLCGLTELLQEPHWRGVTHLL